MKEKILHFILKNILIAIIFIFIIWMCFFDENSFVRHLKIQNELNSQKIEIENFEKENKKFESTIKVYQSDTISPELEKILREDYGFGKQDEIIFKIE